MKAVNWEQKKLSQFTKVFYKEEQSTRSEQETLNFRKFNEIFILSSFCKVPNPFFSWEESFFPPYIMEEITTAGFPNPTPI